MKEQKAEIDERIFASLFNDKFDTTFSSKIGSDQMRCKVKEIFLEEIGKVDFSNTVKKYAAEEMDKRVFRSFQYWVTVILTTVFTGLISSAIAVILSK